MISCTLAGAEAAYDLGELGDEDLDQRRRQLTDHIFGVIVSKLGPNHLSYSRA